ncbi:MAG TPA: hypothetical protein VJX74_07500 [Blastocatellia bacterium]|nr:hypothetical protein [Blastocatellia bacterium]
MRLNLCRLLCRLELVANADPALTHGAIGCRLLCRLLLCRLLYVQNLFLSVP